MNKCKLNALINNIRERELNKKNMFNGRIYYIIFVRLTVKVLVQQIRFDAFFNFTDHNHLGFPNIF